MECCRRQPFHLSRVVNSTPSTTLQPGRELFSGTGSASFFQQSGDSAGSQQTAVQALDNLRQQQAALLAYFDVFWACAVLGAALVLLVLLMKRSVAENRAHVGAD